MFSLISKNLFIELLVNIIIIVFFIVDQVEEILRNTLLFIINNLKILNGPIFFKH